VSIRSVNTAIPQGNRVDSNTISGNRGPGVSISQGNANIVGKADGTTGQGNTITGNAINRILITLGNGNLVRGNRIGIKVVGAFFRGVVEANTGSGVKLVDSRNAVVGGKEAGLRNYISGNSKNGVEIGGDGASGNQVLGNYIGTNLTGDSDFDDQGNYTANAQNGVLISGGNGGVVGAVAGGNLISGNTLSGVAITGGSGHTVQKNQLGSTADGTGALVNGDVAIAVSNSKMVTVSSNKGFRLSGKAGVKFDTTAQRGKIDKDNEIDVEPAGGGGNSSDGPPAPAIIVVNSDDVTVGGTDSGDGNVLDTGLAILNSTNVVVQGNFVGVGSGGTSFGNPGDGIFIDAASTGSPSGAPTPRPATRSPSTPARAFAWTAPATPSSATPSTAATAPAW
jgi:hypothetical protein